MRTPRSGFFRQQVHGILLEFARNAEQIEHAVNQQCLKEHYGQKRRQYFSQHRIAAIRFCLSLP
jgi:hypothetical protein